MSSGTLKKNLPGLLQASLNPWLIKVRDHPERLAFILHRVTGVIIILYLMAHIFVTNTPTRAGWEAWTQVMDQFGNNIWNKIGEWIVAGSVIFHGLNGIRLLLVEFFGVGVGRPVHPKPPYRPVSLYAGQRLMLLIVFSLAVIGWVWAGLIIFG